MSSEQSRTTLSIFQVSYTTKYEQDLVVDVFARDEAEALIMGLNHPDLFPHVDGIESALLREKVKVETLKMYAPDSVPEALRR